jgi:hypothetical protein
MTQAFFDYYRCPGSFVDFRLMTDRVLTGEPGYFTFGSDVICFGKSALQGSKRVTDVLSDAMDLVQVNGSTCVLPFDPTEIANNLRFEQYVGETKTVGVKSVVRKIYYALRPAFPVSVRRHLQKAWLKDWDKRPFPRWPTERAVDQMFEKLMYVALQASSQKRIPFIWFWPEAKSSCAIMTHDVETDVGLQFATELMNINDSFNIKSSFQLIPDARYVVSTETLADIRSRGFEINVHDLKHDGHLFNDHEKFRGMASKINDFANRFGSKGFRAGALYRNQAWFDAFQFSYDMSVPNVGHLDPQRGGCCTVMPYFIGSILEIPVTTIQDYSLFNVLGTYSQDIWNKQIKNIMNQHGLISFIVHPDYLDRPEAVSAYKTLLGRLSNLRAEKNLWIALPGEVDTWWRQRNNMRLLPDGDGWRVEGEGAKRARVAYAEILNDTVHYVFQETI